MFVIMLFTSLIQSLILGGVLLSSSECIEVTNQHGLSTSFFINSKTCLKRSVILTSYV